MPRSIAVTALRSHFMTPGAAHAIGPASSRRRSGWLAAWTLLALLGAPPAWAQFCVSDADCDDGIACSTDSCVSTPLIGFVCQHGWIDCALPDFASTPSGSTCDEDNDSEHTCVSSATASRVSEMAFTSRYAWALCADGYENDVSTDGTAQHRVSFTVHTPGAYRVNVRESWNGSMRAVAKFTSSETADANVTSATGYWTGPGAVAPDLSSPPAGDTHRVPDLPDPGHAHVGTGELTSRGDDIDGDVSFSIYDTSNGEPRSHELTFTWGGHARGASNSEGSVRLGNAFWVDTGDGAHDSCTYPGDPPRTQSGDGHFVDVQVVLLCGNGQIDAEVGEECDTADIDPACCTPDCTLCCGDGVANPGETCDPSVPGPACPLVCGALDFTGTDWTSGQMSLVGGAFWADDASSFFDPIRKRLRLTYNDTGLRGAAWYNPDRIDPSRSWSANFAFQLSYQNGGGADGLSLILQRDGLDADFQSGVDDAPTNDPYLSIGVDTFLNQGVDAFDENLEVHINGTFPAPNGSPTQGLNLANSNFDGCSAELQDCIYTLYAAYNETSRRLTITVTSPNHPGSVSGTWDLDLATLLGTYGDYRAGFAANTGGSAENHDVLRWAFQFQAEPTCGNGIVETGELCDAGADNGTFASCCSTSCDFKAIWTPCADDGNVCTDDVCNGTSAACRAIYNSRTCNDGLFCNGADTCSLGLCVLHAGNPCPGPDGDGNCAEFCDEATDSCSAPDPTCDDGLFCNGADTCSGGNCAVHAGNPCPGPDGDGNCSESCNEATDNCSAPDPNGSACNDGLYCDGTDTCSGGSCATHSGDPCPGLDGDGDCAESCDESADTCIAADPNGSACSDGLFCNGADTCSGGNCTAHAGSPCPGPDGDGNCTESCDESADACTMADPNGSACSDGLFCNGADTCNAGSCAAHAGNPCPRPDGDGNCAESCDEAGDACTQADPNGSACNDGLFCNGTDSCSGGSCTTHAGNPCPGPDGDGNCSETCNEAADACTLGDPNGSVCNDGLYCNGTDTCSGGVCATHSGSPCPGPDGDANCTESCNEPTDTCTAADANGSACNDGTFCNGADTCSSGTCSAHAGSACPGPDGDANCAESCNEAADNCTATDPNGSTCGDGVFCNGSDTCSAGSCAVHLGNPCRGPDGDDNCSESCDEAGDTCTGGDPNGTPCTDGLFCTGVDTCSGGACAAHSGSPCPGPDGDANCAESCNETTNTCNLPDPNGSPCNDGAFCNGTDSCMAATCGLHSGPPCPGPDWDGNCAESCNEAADACTAADPDGTLCRFANGECDQAESCSGGACPADAFAPQGTACGSATDSTCDHADGCDGAGGCATNIEPSTTVCRAATGACDTLEYCDGAGSCPPDGVLASGAPCRVAAGACDLAETCDGVNAACPADALRPSGNECRPAAGACDAAESCDGAGVHCPTDARRPAGTVCRPTTGECDAAENCDGLGPACPSDALQPAITVCRTAAGVCDASERCTGTSASCPPDGMAPNGTSCDDGSFCTGADVCDSGACTGHAGNPCPGSDGDADCAESCNEAADACTAADPDGTSCRTSTGECDSAESCVSGSCPPDGFRPQGVACGDSADGICDRADSCDGVGGCATNLEPNTTVCRSAVADCDAVERCDGAGNCPPDGLLAGGVPCRAATGACDVTDACDGVSVACPADAVLPLGAECRAAAGVCDVAEQCTGASGGCPANAVAPDGTSCDDGLFCTGLESCLAGSCRSTGASCPMGTTCDEASRTCVLDACPPVPAHCATASKTLLLVKHDDAERGEDGLIWKWIKGAAADQGDYADPTNAAAYAFCLYGDGVFLAGLTVPPSSTRWRLIGDKGFRYDDLHGTAFGVQTIILKGTGVDEKSKAVIKGKGVALPYDGMRLPLAATELVAQLHNGANGFCIQGSYDAVTATVNSPTKLKAKTP
jgi:hypothetical protein